MRHDATESGMDVPGSRTPDETARLLTALDRRPRVIPGFGEVHDDYCNRNSCWLEPGHDGECKPGGCGRVGRGA